MTVEKKKPLVLLLLLPLFVLFDCAGVSNKPHLSDSELNWVTVYKISRTNFSHLETLEGQAQLTVQSAGQSYSAETRVKMKRPDSLYFKIEAALGLDVGIFFADRQNYFIYAPMENICYTGAVDSLHKAPLFDIEITFDKLMQLCAGAEILPNMRDPNMHHEGDNIIITGMIDSLACTYYLERGNGLVKKLEIRDPQSRLVAVHEYGRFKKINGVTIPHTIRLQRPLAKESLSLFYTQLKINKKLSGNDFYIKIPDSALKVNL
ncbi:MAG TPA: DUF4292 domain-containing protein [bacterium]|nr:DUF4292 domain-containing protein [bacterium]HPN42527.1 DUF4292 domain-containing protein [bacterium]